MDATKCMLLHARNPLEIMDKVWVNSSHALCQWVVSYKEAFTTNFELDPLVLVTVLPFLVATNKKE